MRDDFPHGKPREHRENYWGERTGQLFNHDDPIVGWYFTCISRLVGYHTWHPVTYRDNLIMIRYYRSYLGFYDRFIYIDDQIIDFPEYDMTYDYDFHEERATTAEGYPARVFVFNSVGTHLGREYWVSLVDTIYQLPPEEYGYSEESGYSVNRIFSEPEKSVTTEIRDGQPCTVISYVSHGRPPQ